MVKSPALPSFLSIGALDRSSRDLSRQLAHALRLAIRCGDLREGELFDES
jgi:GntR family transcriptional regulator/MocR family aminotransferase